MRWHRLALLVALSACGGQSCPLVGCSSQLTVTLPPGTTGAQACVGSVCATQPQGAPAVLVPLTRKDGATTARVTVTVAGRTLSGTVPLTRTRPNGQSCPPECVNGRAMVDLAVGTVTAG